MGTPSSILVFLNFLNLFKFFAHELYIQAQATQPILPQGNNE
jgi:hypothetical protein